MPNDESEKRLEEIKQMADEQMDRHAERPAWEIVSDGGEKQDPRIIIEEIDEDEVSDDAIDVEELAEGKDKEELAEELLRQLGATEDEIEDVMEEDDNGE